MKIFKPKIYQKDIFTINYQNIIKKGYKLIIFDLDNTLGTIDQLEIDKKTINFLNQLTKNIKVVIASNSSNKRVKQFTKNIQVQTISFSLKPTLKILKKLKKQYQLNYQEMVIIGDQILTDIFLGNRKKLLTILVDPLKAKDLKITSLNRKLEKLINKKNKLIKGDHYEE